MTSLTDEPTTVGLREPAESPLVGVQRVGSRATVTLNDPPTLNALSAPLTASLYRALQGLVTEPGVRAVVLTGADPAFSAGAMPAASRKRDTASSDGSGLATASEEGAASVVRLQLGEITRLIARSDTTFIAAINGLAAGAGLALALACDVVIVSDRAVLAPSSGRVGVLPEVGMSWLLTRRLGYHRTLSLFTRGYQLSPKEAAETGLVDAAIPESDLAGAVSFWCDVAGLAATPEIAKALVRSATESSRGRATVMGEFAA